MFLGGNQSTEVEVGGCRRRRTALDGFESIFDLEDVSVGTEDWMESEYLDVWRTGGLASWAYRTELDRNRWPWWLLYVWWRETRCRGWRGGQRGWRSDGVRVVYTAVCY
jgi:hypothetical protein